MIAKIYKCKFNRKCFDDSFRSCYYDELPNPYSNLVFAVPYIDITTLMFGLIH